MGTKKKLYVEVVRVHTNGYRHWGYAEHGERTVVMRGGKEHVRWKGKLYPVRPNNPPFRENIIDLPCTCEFGESELRREGSNLRPGD